MKKKDETKTKQPIFLKFFQFIYLSFMNFNKNVLLENACACSFSFVFSFIPICVISVTILTTIISFSPEAMNFVMRIADLVSGYVDIKPFINSLLNIKSLKFINIFLGVWIIMMARKMFLSVVRAMYIIFHKTVGAQKSFLIQLFTFLFEFIVVAMIITVVIVVFIVNESLKLPVFQYIKSHLPAIIHDNSKLTIGIIAYSLLFLIVFLIYRFTSQISKKNRMCFFYAAICTGATFVISYLLNLFLNTTNYNSIYGTISTLIIMMLKVYIFFTIFLFCAQMMYVSHNFVTMLKGEIYLLPEFESDSFDAILHRVLFINPSLIQTKENTLFFNVNEIIFSKGEKPNFVYYVKRGTVYEYSENQIKYYDQGSFFGEPDCILNHRRTSEVKSVTPCEIMTITKEDFMQLLEVYPDAAQKAIAKINV
jgi:membrane protein